MNLNFYGVLSLLLRLWSHNYFLLQVIFLFLPTYTLIFTNFFVGHNNPILLVSIFFLIHFFLLNYNIRKSSNIRLFFRKTLRQLNYCVELFTINTHFFFRLIQILCGKSLLILYDHDKNNKLTTRQYNIFMGKKTIFSFLFIKRNWPHWRCTNFLFFVYCTFASRLGM